MAAFSFGKDRRLRKRADFLRVQSSGRRVSTPHFTLLIAAQPVPSEAAARADGGEGGARATASSRLGIVVTKKIGGAVQRNRIKRVCRECFRLWPEFLPPGTDVVVIAKPGADTLGLADVKREWSEVERIVKKRAQEALARSRSDGQITARTSSRSNAAADEN